MTQVTGLIEDVSFEKSVHSVRMPDGQIEQRTMRSRISLTITLAGFPGTDEDLNRIKNEAVLLMIGQAK